MKPSILISIPWFPPARLTVPEGTTPEQLEEWRAAWERKMQEPGEVERINERYSEAVAKRLLS